MTLPARRKFSNCAPWVPNQYLAASTWGHFDGTWDAAVHWPRGCQSLRPALTYRGARVPPTARWESTTSAGISTTPPLTCGARWGSAHIGRYIWAPKDETSWSKGSRTEDSAPPGWAWLPALRRQPP